MPNSRDDNPPPDASTDVERTVEQRVIGAEGGPDFDFAESTPPPRPTVETTQPATQPAPVVATSAVVDRTAPATVVDRTAPVSVTDRTALEARWPSGKSPDTASIRFPEAELHQTAGFGNAPDKWYKTPFYAFRVYRRSRALEERLSDLDQRLAAESSRRDALLADMVLGLRGALEDDPELRPLLEPVRRIEAQLAERHRALTETDREYEKIAADADQRVDAARKEVAVRRATEQESAAALNEAEKNLQRVLERLKRFQGEITSIREATGQGAGHQPSGPISPESAARLHELEGQVAAIEPERSRLDEQVEAARMALGEADSELGKAARALSTYEAERRAIDRRFQEKLGARAEEVRDAETQRVSVLADVGRAVLAKPGCVKIDKSTLEAIGQADAEVVDRTIERERLARALGTYDQSTVTRGYTVMGIFVVLLGLIGVLIVAIQL